MESLWFVSNYEGECKLLYGPSTVCDFSFLFTNILTDRTISAVHFRELTENCELSHDFDTWICERDFDSSTWDLVFFPFHDCGIHVYEAFQ